MIRYENITADDMKNYWGAGCVFLNHHGKWNAYNLDRAYDDEVVLLHNSRMGRYGDPPESVTMTYSQFFEAALLHRPPLGALVRGQNEVFLLGWQHADGQDMVKALRDADVYVAPVLEKKRAEDVPPWEVAWRDGLLRNKHLHSKVPRDCVAWMPPYSEDIERNRAKFLLHPDVVDTVVEETPGVRKQATKLVLAFLNQETKSIREALCAPRKAPCYLSGTAWLMPDGDDLLLMAGRHRVGVLPKDGRCGIELDANPAKALIGQRLFTALY